MSIRVGINGMGRVGRAYLRCATGTDDLEVVSVNDVADPTMIARLLRRDSTYGRFGKEVVIGEDTLVVEGRKVAISAFREPQDLPWADQGVDVVVESTGRFRTREAAAGHLRAGQGSRRQGAAGLLRHRTGLS
jgi:glyceraldehyde 3-phosphate dehydrogenase